MELKPSKSGLMSNHYCMCRSSSQEINSIYSAILITSVHQFIAQIANIMQKSQRQHSKSQCSIVQVFKTNTSTFIKNIDSMFLRAGKATKVVLFIATWLINALASFPARLLKVISNSDVGNQKVKLKNNWYQLQTTQTEGQQGTENSWLENTFFMGDFSCS